MQTDKIKHFPTLLMGIGHWDGLMNWIRGQLVGTGRIAPGDVELLRATDDPGEVCSIADVACARQRAAYGEDRGR